MGCDFYLMTDTKIKFINCDCYDIFDTEITERIYCINDNHFKELSNDNIVTTKILYTKNNKWNKWCIDTQNVEKLYSFIREIKAFLKKYHKDKSFDDIQEIYTETYYQERM